MIPAGLVARSVRRRRIRDAAFVAICLAAASLLVLVLAILIGAVVATGWRHLDWEFLTSFSSRRASSSGIRAAVAGSVWLCAVCAATALPLGVGAAVFLEEYRPRAGRMLKVHRFIQLNIQNLAGVPSIVYGIIGLTVFVRFFGLLGSPNETMYDRMTALTLTSGERVVGELADPSGVPLTLMTPLGGRIEVDPATVRSRTEFYVREHIFTLKGGEELRGAWSATDPEGIHLRLASGEHRTLEPAQVAGYGTINMLRAGDPDTPFFIQLPFGDGVLSGGLTLALVILPIIIIASQEALRAVPDSLRQGALAAGATRWQMVRRMTLPAAIPGIMTGAILGVSRAIGEAAPLLIIGGVQSINFVPRHLISSFAAMPLQIYSWAGRPQDEFREIAATGIIVLLGVLLLFNAAAIIIRQVFQKPLQ